ncbi:MAG: condensation domain-containing protein, partial [Acidobacteria bacterium]|nr:condensation domain-containing protein [Acidobacteriota bacterium]
MTVYELLSRLRGLDVRLWLEGERLRFSAPQGVFTDELRAEVAQRKAEVVAFLRAGGADSVLSARRGRAAELPLSYAQQRLWFLDQMSPGQSVYNVPAAIRLTGRLNVEALRQSLRELTRRHEVLRTSFPAVDGRPTQAILREPTLTLALADLRGLPTASREAAADRLIARAARSTFELSRGPLLRIALLWMGEGEYVLSLTMHHIVSDGWSMWVLIRELAAIYGSYSAGAPSALPEPQTQYADFALWQREWLSGEVLEGQLDYWKRQLTGAPPVLHLPTDRPGSAVQSFRGAHERFALPEELSGALKRLSQAEGVTLFMTLLAAFQVLLARYTGQSDIPVGVPIANRTRAETEPLVGLFANSLVMRTSLAGDPTFRELLGRVRRVALGAYTHQDLPLERLVEELQVERSLSHTPLFQVMFALQNAPQVSLELPGLRLERFDIETGTVKFDLTLEMEEAGPSLRGSFGYQTDLFKEETVELLIAHFRTLLTAASADPDRHLSELPMFGEAERRRILSWERPDAEFAREECLHEWFARQAARTPDAVALSDEAGQVTYAELDRRTNRLARRLRRLGVGPESVVGLYLTRGLGMIEAIIGVLKAGGAYLPLDASSPAERIRMMVED